MNASAANYRGTPSTGRRWLTRLAVAVGIVTVVGAVVWGGMTMGHGPSGPKRQIAKIMVLPDTPPPPPPPEEKRPPPKEEQPKQQMETPKQETPPEPAQLKMEGQAGEGPSPFAAGEVRSDYIGGDIGTGARYAAYVARLEQRVQAKRARFVGDDRHHIFAHALVTQQNGQEPGKRHRRGNVGGRAFQ